MKDFNAEREKLTVDYHNRMTILDKEELFAENLPIDFDGKFFLRFHGYPLRNSNEIGYAQIDTNLVHASAILKTMPAIPYGLPSADHGSKLHPVPLYEINLSNHVNERRLKLSWCQAPGFHIHMTMAADQFIQPGLLSRSERPVTDSEYVHYAGYSSAEISRFRIQTVEFAKRSSQSFSYYGGYRKTIDEAVIADFIAFIHKYAEVAAAGKQS